MHKRTLITMQMKQVLHQTHAMYFVNLYIYHLSSVYHSCNGDNAAWMCYWGSFLSMRKVKEITRFERGDG